MNNEEKKHVSAEEWSTSVELWEIVFVKALTGTAVIVGQGYSTKLGMPAAIVEAAEAIADLAVVKIMKRRGL